jgi:hypothetical protein
MYPPERDVESRSPERAACATLHQPARLYYYNAGFMIANDVVMYLTPMVLLWRVDQIRDQRWSLYALFGICFL